MSTVKRVAYPWYRIRFTTSVAFAGQKPCDVTAYPGIIRRNRPRADRYLKAIEKGGRIKPWLEIKDSPEAEWRRL